MRRLLLLVLLVPLLLVPGRGTLAAWTDPAPPSTGGTLLSSLTLTAPTLSCTETTGPLGSNAATVSWTPSTTPTTLTYGLTVVDNGSTPAVSGNSSSQLYPSLLGTLFGTTITVRVTGTLPGTSWTTATERTLVVGLAGLYVNCS